MEKFRLHKRVLAVAVAFACLAFWPLNSLADAPCDFWTDTPPGTDNFSATGLNIEVQGPKGAFLKLKAVGPTAIERQWYDTGAAGMPAQIVELLATGHSVDLGGGFKVVLDPSMPSNGLISTCSDCGVGEDTVGVSYYDVHYLVITNQPYPDDTLRGTAHMVLTCDDDWVAFPGGKQGVFVPPDGYSFRNLQPEPIYDNEGLIFGDVFLDHDLRGWGACCYPDGSCMYLPEDECWLTGGVSFYAGQFCLGDNDGNGVDDICEQDIPTLTEWGMIIFCVLLFGWMAWMIVRRRKKVTIGM